MDTYARNCWFFVAEGHLSEGLPDGTVVNTSHLYIIPVETEGGGAAPGGSPDQTRLCLGFAATSLSVQKISEFSSIERYPRRA